jgi:hypothetical protein
MELLMQMGHTELLDVQNHFPAKRERVKIQSFRFMFYYLLLKGPSAL